MSVTVKQMTITQMSRVILSDLQGSDDVVPSVMLLILLKLIVILKLKDQTDE